MTPQEAISIGELIQQLQAISDSLGSETPVFGDEGPSNPLVGARGLVDIVHAESIPYVVLVLRDHCAKEKA